MRRERLSQYIPKSEPVIEIGPLDRPFLTKDSYNVYYADIQSKEEVVKNYLSSAQSNYLKSGYEFVSNTIMDIDLVISDSYVNAVGDRKFAAVFSSHVIEHVPDILDHLIDINKILTDKGRYVMAIPDKRYTFDHFREVTPFRDALDVYKGRGELNRLIFDFEFMATKNNIPYCYFLGEVPFEPINGMNTPAADDILSLSSDLNSSRHLWVFTYKSFLAFIRDGIRAKLLPYRIIFSEPPKPLGSNEFHIVLEKCEAVISDESVRNTVIEEIQSSIRIVNENVDANGRYLFDTHEKVYIYGAGKLAQHFFTILLKDIPNLAGFIVSDDQSKSDTLFDYPVLHLSEVPDKSKSVVILALNETNRDQVLPIIEQAGFENILVF